MALEWEQVLVHSVDPVGLGQWWAEALGRVVVHSSTDELEIRPEPDRMPGLDFVRLDEPKQAGDASWVVLADPEGNEFCVLGPRQ